ncbi:MAG: hypothetical protein BAJALOKI3v1_790014 [Promethearchaeota archaeon]|jgi:glyoxylase-like metal-dependent hydrolase (beta-lactamase superfamily II)|nr:MAG: hypothetical protein BAJALOKI3v1_790014 [Candidatus Lokiarchaeota archaeon]
MSNEVIELENRFKLNQMDISERIRIIKLEDVNCYLVESKDGYILIDSGLPKNRKQVEEAILAAGCYPGDLKLIVVTHGDSDHVGNCKYLREKFQTKIAMHRDDIGMVEFGDFTYNRDLNIIIRGFGKLMAYVLKVNLRKEDRFTPDLFLVDGQSLSEYGYDADVFTIPGHSRGSIGILDKEGNLFCGDLLENIKKPIEAKMIADKKAYKKSIDRITELSIKKVFPGHGEPFFMEEF